MAFTAFVQVQSKRESLHSVLMLAHYVEQYMQYPFWHRTYCLARVASRINLIPLQFKFSQSHT
jgi:hypothetical protein